jgi:hypothetical protein
MPPETFLDHGGEVRYDHSRHHSILANGYNAMRNLPLDPPREGTGLCLAAKFEPSPFTTVSQLFNGEKTYDLVTRQVAL